MEFLILIPVLLAIIGVVALVAFFAYRRAWRIPQPNEALIIVGKSRGNAGAVVAQEQVDGTSDTVADAIEADKMEGLDFKIATAATWVNPLTSRVFPLSLSSRSTTFEAEGHDTNKIAVTVRGVLLYKVADNFDAIARAARRFLDVDEDSMNQAIEQLVTGQVRALVGEIGIEQLITDRQALMDKVQEATKTDMAVLGLKIDSLTVQEISDGHGYIENLGRPQAEAIAREASVAADVARREKEEAKQAADIEIARVRRDTEVKAAEYKAEQDKAMETAAQSGPRARAEAEAAVVEMETKVAEMRVAQAAKRYEAEVGERAKADRFRVEQEAAANKAAELAKVEAEAARERQIGEARAAAVRAAGEAEANAIELRGVAEAKATKEKAAALAENGDAVIEQRISEVMPEIAAAVASPFANIDNLVVLDGPEGLTKAVTGGIAAAGNTAVGIRDLVRVLQGHEPQVSAKGEGDREPLPSPGAVAPSAGPGTPAPPRTGESDRSAPPLGEIMPEGDHMPAASTTGSLDEGRKEVLAGSRKGLEALRGMMGGDLSKLERRELLDLGDRIRSDPETRAAFQAVAQDDGTFEQMLSELPLRGASGEVFEKFAREFREQSLAGR